jgi:hypothetical protein
VVINSNTFGHITLTDPKSIIENFFDHVM